MFPDCRLRIVSYAAAAALVGLSVLQSLPDRFPLQATTVVVVALAAAYGGTVRAREWRPIVVLVVASGLACTSICYFGRDLPPAQLIPQGDALVARVEAYRKANGRVPLEFHNTGTFLPATRVGTWRYSPSGDGFTLFVGDYGRDGFTLYWDDDAKNWGVDS